MRYQSGDISIDDDFARFGSKSYAIDKINSVDIKGQKAGGCAWLVTGLIALVAGLMALGSFGSGQIGVGALVLIVAALFGWWTFKAYKASQVVTYTVLLTTSSSEAQATQSIDYDEIQNMRLAIEAAMARKP